MSEEDYDNSHPAINYEWWTYDEYKEWLEQEKKTLQEMADEHAMAETSEGSFEWTQEMTDQCIAEYEQTLEDIKNGLLVSKSVDGDAECMTTFNPNWVRQLLPTNSLSKVDLDAAARRQKKKAVVEQTI